ncbi:very short patch repair endonuclease [Burkholderia oklahomensis]|uniref:very short patch repair endonuclease n=2 Tax=Burkholderia oklahomensis TaxID=342113 RepID=UPI002E11DC6B
MTSLLRTLPGGGNIGSRHSVRALSMPASPNATSRRMARTVGKDNPRERALRSALHRQGIRFRIHYAAIPGTRRSIDIAFTRLRLAVFCDGCFWHGCPAHATIPKTRREWWGEKIMANKIRDRDTDARLINSGWTVMRIWEHVPLEDAVAMIRTTLQQLNERALARGQPKSGR